MFDHFVWSVVVVPPLFVLVAYLCAGRLDPWRGAVVLAWSAAGAAFASTANLLVFALKAIAELPAVAGLFDWSHHTVALDTGHVPWVSWLSLVLLAGAVAAAGRVWWRHRRVLRAAGELAGLPSHEGVLVLADAAPLAYAVPGRPGVVVVTTGMRAALTAEQYAALLAHERAHLAGRHHRLIRLAAMSGAAHPALRWVARQVDYLVERAADERAAVEVGSRRTVARAIGAAALAVGDSAGRPGAPVPVASAVARAGDVPRRVGALLRPAGTLRARYLAILPAALAVGSIIWTGEAVYDLHELLRAARVTAR
ncbi:M56 family metallopeptidase [Phytohabitans kaempferiae]|uniref:M56 family metallopeptidase n=1 Tax=Phytohabitans kaempferiae TaxID=1620943 RepID=A0ABV6MBD0_9ACTN